MSFVKLGEICEFINGKAFNADDWRTSGVPIVRIQNLNDETKPFNYCHSTVEEKFHVNTGDLLFSWSGTPGTSFGAFIWERGHAYLNQHIFNVKVRHDVDKRYLFHSLNASIHLMIDQAHGGVGLQHITKKKLEGIEIKLPELKEQKRIAAILDKADSLRRKRQQATRLADDFLRAVFLDMFGDPVTNPKGWPVGTIRDLVASANYGSSEKADETEGQYPILRMNNLTYEGRLDLSSLKYVDLDDKVADKYLARKGDLLFNRTNSKELVGKTAVYDRDETMAIAGYLIRVRMNEKGNPYYVSAYLNSAHGKATLQAMCKSIVGMANINAQEMQNIRIMLPPIDLQDRYANVVGKMRATEKTFSQSGEVCDKLIAALSTNLLS